MKGKCRGFPKELKENWNYDEVQNIYSFSDNKFPFKKECLYGLNENELTILLGKPSSRYENQLRYYMTKGCFNKPPGNCTLIYVTLNKETGKVEEITGGVF